MNPRIFVSGVTHELKTVRQLTANQLSSLGYDADFKEVFGLDPGELLQALRNRIDACEGLIQLVGQAFGQEPPVDTEFGPVSYTQFEFLYARSRGKKTWLIFVEEGCTRDKSLEDLDRPSDPGHPDPTGYQADRRALQVAWINTLKKENHVHGIATSDAELQLAVTRVQDKPSELRQKELSFRNRVSRTLAIAVALLVLVGAGVWRTVFWQPGEVQHTVQKVVTETLPTAIQEQTPQMAKAIASELAELKPDDIRDQLRKTIEATYQKDLVEADALKEWQKRDEAKRGAAATRDRRFDQLEEFLNSITRTIKSGDASPEFLELTRIIQKEGVDQALAYVTSQESRLLERAEKLAAEKQRELRRTLAPLLKGVELHRSNGELIAAHELVDKLLKQDGDWPNALHEHLWTMMELGTRAERYETTEIALADFQAAENSVQRLLKMDPENLAWQRDFSVLSNKFGDAFQKLGRTVEAKRSYEAALKIARTLAESDATDVQKQRDLSVSLELLGNLLLMMGPKEAAKPYHEEAFKIRRALAEADPNDVQKKCDLAVSYECLGNVSLASGNTNAAWEYFSAELQLAKQLASSPPGGADAKRFIAVVYDNLGKVLESQRRTNDAKEQYEESLRIRRELVATDHSDVQSQRELAISLEKLGNVCLGLQQKSDAERLLTESMSIRRKLADEDPIDTQKQRDLSVSYSNLGDLSLALKRLDDALLHFENGLKIARRLAEIDPNDAQKQRDLAVACNKVGDVFMALKRTQDAQLQFEESLKIRRKLADADPRDAQKQRDLTISFDRLGDVLLKLNQPAEATMYFKESFSIRRTLADADPSNAGKQHDVVISYSKLGAVQMQCSDFGEAIASFRQGIAILNEFIEKKLLPESAKNEKKILEKRIENCQSALIATGDWDELLKSDSSSIPKLLSLRMGLFAKRGQTADVAQVAAKLRELEPKTNGNLYDAACAYGLCATLVVKDNPKPTEAELVEKAKFVNLALACLKEAIAAGYNNFDHMRQDPDLTSLHGSPEFEALLPKKTEPKD